MLRGTKNGRVQHPILLLGRSVVWDYKESIDKLYKVCCTQRMNTSSQDKRISSFSHAGRTVEQREQPDGSTYSVVKDDGRPAGYLSLVGVLSPTGSPRADSAADIYRRVSNQSSKVVL